MKKHWILRINVLVLNSANMVEEILPGYALNVSEIIELKSLT